ncbi:unnamed protein product [Caenorhabditis sp. 36 PRJEB53466]|nr:unnamed protein product [Caenorhabditis sp. 36 PRJEB53466]
MAITWHLVRSREAHERCNKLLSQFDELVEKTKGHMSRWSKGQTIFLETLLAVRRVQMEKMIAESQGLEGDAKHIIIRKYMVNTIHLTTALINFVTAIDDRIRSVS